MPSARKPVVAALLVAAVLTFPYLLVPHLSLFGVTKDVDQSFYAARMTGAYPVDTARLALTDTLGFAFLKPLYLATGSPEAAWVLARFLLAAAWTLLLYALLERATGKPRASLALAAAITLFGDLAFAAIRWGQWPFLSVPEALSHLAMLSSPANLYLGPFRLLSPGFSFACLLASLLPFTGGGLGWRGRAVAGLGVGLLMYVHVDVWSIALVALVLLRSWREASIALAVSIPWLLTAIPPDPDFLQRNKAVFTHAPEWSSLVFMAAGLWSFTSPNKVMKWLGAALLGVFAGMNTQVLTGVSVQPFHWALIGLFLFAILGGIALASRSRESSRWTYALAGLLVLGAARGVAWSFNEAQTLRLAPETREALAWLAKEHPGAIVAALSPEAALTLPAYARSRTLALCDSSVAADLPVAENAARLAWTARRLGVSREAFVALASQPASASEAGISREPWGVLVAAEKTLLPYVYFSEFPRQDLKAVLEAAWEEAGTRRYSVNYAWVGPFERELLGPAAGRLGRPEFSNAWYSLYR